MAIQLKNNVNEPGRNDLCICGSGLKFKLCHGDPLKKAVCNRIVDEKMMELIMVEKHLRGLLSDVDYSAYLARRNPKTPREPVTGSDVNQLIDEAGIARCVDCDTIVPSGDKLCKKCKKIQ